MLDDRLVLARQVWRKFAADNGALLAAAVSFYSFFSLFPLLLLAVGVVGYAFGSPQHAEAILNRLTGKFVVGAQAQSIIHEIVHGRYAATGVGLVMLLWSGTSSMVVLEQAMNLAWSTSARRTYLARRGIALLTLLVIAVLGLVSFGAAALIRAASSTNAPYMAWMRGITPALTYPIPALASIGLFVTIYKLLNTRVSWRTALVGGVFAGVMWETAKHVFAFYIVHWPGHNRVYGSLASVILLMLWLDYSAVIAILGAEFASLWSRRREGSS